MTRWFFAPAGALTSAYKAVSNFVRLPFGRAIATAGVCALALAGCNSITSFDDGGGGDGINDAALGVAASPRVTNQETNLPRGGGRDQVGRPYRIGGQLYTPREDPNYDRTGIASWYGDAFHGRLTANGEIYDQHTLSAAHPTLPLPSYVRVTNLENNRSVVVRVNDRGPFAHDRIIDLSSRAADVLDFRNDGIADVRVQFIDRAPLHGQDVAWLEASAQINGVPVGGGDPNVMLARAPLPAPTPAVAPTQIALAAQPVQQPVAQPPAQNFLNTLFQPQSPASSGAPLDLTPPVRAPVAAFQTPASAAPTVTFAPQVPSGPLPPAAIGFQATDLATGFTPRNRSDMHQAARIEAAHSAARSDALEAASHLALQSQTLERLANGAGSMPIVTANATAAPVRAAIVQIGIFGDPANVARLQRELARLGEVETSPLDRNGRELTRVQLRAPVADADAEQSLLRSLASQGYTDAYIASIEGA